MPQIKGYDAGDVGLRPSEIGVDAVAAAARRIGSAYDQAGARLGSAISTAGKEVDSYISHREISAGAADFAQKTAELTDKWNQFVKGSDPNDPSIAARFNEQVLAPELEKFQGQFNTEAGQNWAQSHVDSLRQHMFTKTAADMSTVAGAAVVENIRKSENAWTNTARNDPSSTKFLLDQAERSVGAIIASSPNLSPADAARVKAEGLQKTKEAIVKAGAMGAMEKSSDPEAAAATFAQRFPEYVNGQEIDQLARTAKYYQRLNVAETRADRVQRDYDAKSDFHSKMNELEISTIPQTAGGPPQLPPDYWDKLRELSKHPGAAIEPGRIKSMVENGERITARLNKPEPLGPESHQTTIELLNRIRATDPSRLTSNDEIYKAYGDGKLNNTDFKFLQQEYQALRTPEGQALGQDRARFFKQYAGAIAGRTFDPVLGSPKLYAAEMDARRREMDIAKRGGDPHEIYDPSSPNFFGKPANLQKYQGSMQEDLDAKAAKATENINLTAPGTTITSIEKVDPAPSEPGQRKAGTVYDTPKGILKWTGTGWVKP